MKENLIKKETQKANMQKFKYYYKEIRAPFGCISPIGIRKESNKYYFRFNVRVNVECESITTETVKIACSNNMEDCLDIIEFVENFKEGLRLFDKTEYKNNRMNLGYRLARTAYNTLLEYHLNRINRSQYNNEVDFHPNLYKWADGAKNGNTFPIITTKDVCDILFCDRSAYNIKNGSAITSLNYDTGAMLFQTILMMILIANLGYGKSQGAQVYTEERYKCNQTKFSYENNWRHITFITGLTTKDKISNHRGCSKQAEIASAAYFRLHLYNNTNTHALSEIQKITTKYLGCSL